MLLAVLVAWADVDVNELEEAACVEGAGLGWVNGKLFVSVSLPSFSLTRCTRIIMVRADLCTRASFGHIDRQCTMKENRQKKTISGEWQCSNWLGNLNVSLETYQKQTVYSQSMSTHPGVRANILTKAGVSDKFLRTKHPRLSMDLLVWKFFIATTVRRAIWYMWEWIEDPSPSFFLLSVG